MRFIQTNEPGEDDFSRRLSEFVEKAKKNEKFRKEYADMNLHDFDIMTEAAEQKAIEDAVIAVTKFHIPIDDVAREYGVDKSEIESRLQPAPAN